MEHLDGIVLTLFGYDIEIQAAVLNWLVLGAVLCMMLIIMGNRRLRKGSCL